MQSRRRATKIFKGKGKNGRTREEGEARYGRHKAKGRQSLGCCVVVSYRFTCNRLFRRFYRGMRRPAPRRDTLRKKTVFIPTSHRIEGVIGASLDTLNVTRMDHVWFSFLRESVLLKSVTERRRHLVKHPSPLFALKIAKLLKVNLLHTRIRERIGFKTGKVKVNLLDKERDKMKKFRQVLSWRKAPNTRGKQLYY